MSPARLLSRVSAPGETGGSPSLPPGVLMQATRYTRGTRTCARTSEQPRLAADLTFKEPAAPSGYSGKAGCPCPEAVAGLKIQVVRSGDGPETNPTSLTSQRGSLFILPAGIVPADWFSGGVAGCCAKTTTAPLDRVKILLQAHNHHYKHLGVFSTLCAVPKKEGYLGLYKGNGAMMIRIFPYGAIQFMAFDQYKKIIKKQLGISGHVHRLMAGSMAGITAVICTYPLDMVRVRLAFQVKGEHKYMGIIHAFKMIYTKEGGFSGFYRGLMPTIVGMAPYAGFSFFTFGTLKSIGLAQAPNLLGRPSLDNPDVLVLKTHVNLLCGGIAGAIAQTISYPLDVTRRRMQLGAVLPDSEKCLTMVQTLKYVYQQHGIRRGLYRGLSLNYIRCIPSQAVAFTTYELMKQFLHLN
ncbi:PREDICTED: graves disease carrier protein [Buceros rhinoceros silvestris]|nr:PREDICTED: graves disease carrier protein [Buceros rhinoceros silvestris]